MANSYGVVTKHGGNGVFDVDDGGADVDQDVAEVTNVPLVIKRSAVTFLFRSDFKVKMVLL